jgi:hypothetical protein
MTKIKKTNSHSRLTLTGYILFSLLIVSVLLSTTIPFWSLLFNPHALRVNVAISTIALTIGAFLPVLVGYVIGDHSIKTKSRLYHHFNGVLFGLLAYWIMMIFTTFVSIPSDLASMSQNARIILINTLPSFAVAAITTALAVAHVRSPQAKHDIFDYKPYRILLIGCVILLPAWSLFNSILTQSVNIHSFVPLTITVLVGAISYTSLRNSTLNKLSKITWSAISVSVAYVTVLISWQLVSGLSYYLTARPTMEFQSMTSNFAWVLALVGWGIYWSIQVKSLSEKNYSK